MAPLPPASLARSAVHRNHRDRGTDGTLADVLARRTTRVVLAHRGTVLTARGHLVRFTVDDLDGLDLLPEDPATGPTRVYLGRAEDGTDYVGLDLDDAARSRVDTRLAGDLDTDAEPQLDDPATGVDVAVPAWIHLRDVGLAFDDLDVGLACEIVALGNWHRAHTRSPRNGAPTVPAAGGWVRTDPETGSEHFPRTDPAVIMAVVHTDAEGTERILLGNNALWPDDRYSLLAGFVEPGETLERAVIREVHEETGVLATDPRYLGSQPWPFPCSLMLGFVARTADMTTDPDLEEISHVRWFTREELRAEQEARTVWTPGTVSIAGQILHAWLDGEA